MPKQTLTDREMLTDALSSEKFMTENYNTYANECASPSLMNEFMNLLSEEHQIQHDVFSELQKRGWYPIQSAPAEKVQQAKMKFSKSFKLNLLKKCSRKNGCIFCLICTFCFSIIIINNEMTNICQKKQLDFF